MPNYKHTYVYVTRLTNGFVVEASYTGKTFAATLDEALALVTKHVNEEEDNDDSPKA